MQCTLCQSQKCQTFYSDDKRQWAYWLCQDCDFVFRDPKSYLTHQAEKQRYDTHNNSIENKGYVRFLSPVVEWLAPYLKKGHRGLDYGCGPGPILDQLLSPLEVELQLYDPYYCDDTGLLQGRYDFITCTEVFEHFYKPHQEIKTLVGLLNPGGYLLIMSEWRRDRSHFANWGYRMDNTHVCFLNESSLKTMAENFGFDVLRFDGRLSLLQKKI